MTVLLKGNRMKKLLIVSIVVVGILIGAGGCESVKLDGFSIGATYLNTDITTTNSLDAGYFGEFTESQTTKVEGLMPTFSLNFKFE